MFHVFAHMNSTNNNGSIFIDALLYMYRDLCMSKQLYYMHNALITTLQVIED